MVGRPLSALGLAGAILVSPLGWVDALGVQRSGRVATRVDDGVIGPAQCMYLGRYLRQCAAGEASSVREASALWDSTMSPRSPVESFLGSYLAEHDEAPAARYVEYWAAQGRNEWGRNEWQRATP